ncbi:XRE family transcriptional regulator [Streptacidiphilus sp. N1-12]|uniref:XRE family transcriptional regulator n=1 Tax=Streptacidiphilus alkalitolerans TaxID=3342712 RepID=A0ABV6WRF8_9ACTN
MAKDYVGDALERGDGEHFTRKIPVTPLAQIRLLLKAEKNSTKAVAARLGVSQRTVERYLAGQRKTPRKALRDALVREASKVWQPRVRQQARRRAAASGGITIETRARFGYTAAAGSTDDPRERLLTVHLPAAYAGELFQAQQNGASDQELREIVAKGFQEIYFQDGGRRADQLSEVEIQDITYLDVKF